MVPLTTLQGLPATEIVGRVGGRSLFVWGCGDVALDVLTCLRKLGLQPKALLHSAPPVGFAHGLPVTLPDECLSDVGGDERPFIVIAAARHVAAAVTHCLQAGLRRGEDFLTQYAIPRPRAMVSVAAGLPDPVRLMPYEQFAAIIDKLAGDVPLLTHVEFALVGDPLTNPDLPRMIAKAGCAAPCSVVTRLAGDLPIRDVLAAGPHRLEVVVDGYGSDFDQFAASGRSWPAFLTRFAELRRALDDAPQHTRAVVRLMRRRSHHTEEFARWRELLQEATVDLDVHIPYLMPYDDMLAYCRGGAFPDRAFSQVRWLPWSVEKVLSLCRRDAALPCLSQRVFPVIGSDGGVSTCHLYSQDGLADNYLETGWQELLVRRHSADLCRHCQEFGLHRLDVDVLTRRHSEQVYLEN